jgi:hypothetical protein
MLSNIEVEPGDATSELKVYTNFLVYRSRSRGPWGLSSVWNCGR